MIVPQRVLRGSNHRGQRCCCYAAYAIPVPCRRATACSSSTSRPAPRAGSREVQARSHQPAGRRPHRGRRVRTTFLPCAVHKHEDRFGCIVLTVRRDPPVPGPFQFYLRKFITGTAPTRDVAHRDGPWIRGEQPAPVRPLPSSTRGCTRMVGARIVRGRAMLRRLRTPNWTNPRESADYLDDTPPRHTMGVDHFPMLRAPGQTGRALGYWPSRAPVRSACAGRL